MAASKKKTTTKKSPAKKTRTVNVSKAQTDWSQSPIVRLCFFLILSFLALIAFLKLGFVGHFLFQTAALFIGYMAYFLYAFLFCYGLWQIFSKKETLSRRMKAGIFCLFSALVFAFAMHEYKGLQAQSVLFDQISSSLSIWKEQSSASGLYGALLYTIIVTLLDRAGGYLCDALFFLLAIVLMGYGYKDLLQEKSSKVIEAKKEQHRIKKEKKAQEKELLDFDINDSALYVEPGIEMYTLQPEHFESSFADISADDVPVKGKKKKQAKAKPAAKIKENFGILADEPESAEPYFAPSQENLDDIIEETEKALKARAPQNEKSVPQNMQQELPPIKGDNEPQSYVFNPNPYENYKLPKLSLLNDVSRKSRSNVNTNAARIQGANLIELLHQFNINAKLSEVHIGPSVTKFEIKLEPGTRVSKINSLSGDIKMALAATDIRIEAPIPGKSAVGIEIPNVEKTTVQMKEVLMRVPENLANSPLLMALGKDLMGECVFGQMEKMPHLLIAGATGSGKSVCVNSIICSFLLRTRPDEVKLILIDPKKVEFTPYNAVPHLLAPVITDATLASKALQVVVRMMDNRYDLFGACGVRNIEGYNQYLAEHAEEKLKKLPRIVVIIDELADLMLAASKEVEASIQRITQLARAAGIHLIVATQRPSVDIITGVIKANIPSRIAFAVSSAVDSRTILDQTGAERLLGYGDMLYLPNGETAALRVQGVFIRDEEVNAICEYVKSQGTPQYDDSFVTLKDLSTQGKQVSPDKADPLYNEVKQFVISSKKASTSLIQRKFSIGYGRAARLIDMLEDNGIVGPSNGSKPRKILVQNTYDSEESSI
jgi:S-DNA-T family DNA segregation ATPase FtsK/SpoIIIE